MIGTWYPQMMYWAQKKKVSLCQLQVAFPVRFLVDGPSRWMWVMSEIFSNKLLKSQNLSFSYFSSSFWFAILYTFLSLFKHLSNWLYWDKLVLVNNRLCGFHQHWIIIITLVFIWEKNVAVTARPTECLG